MKKFLTIAAVILVTIAALWVTLGTTGLGIALGVIALAAYTFAAFGAGWYAAQQAMQQGAKLTLDAIQLNAQQDSAMLQAVKTFVSGRGSARGQAQAAPQIEYPMLGGGETLPAAPAQPWYEIPISGGNDDPQ